MNHRGLTRDPVGSFIINATRTLLVKLRESQERNKTEKNGIGRRSYWRREGSRNGEIKGGAESDQNILKMYMKWLKGIN